MPQPPSPPPTSGIPAGPPETAGKFDSPAPPPVAAPPIAPPPVASPSVSPPRRGIRGAEKPVVASGSEEGASFWSRRQSIRDSSSFLTSLVVHCLGLIVLALLTNPPTGTGKGLVLLVESANQAEFDNPDDLSITTETPQLESAPLYAPMDTPAQMERAPDVESPFAAPAPLNIAANPVDEARQFDATTLLQASNLPSGGGLEGRTQERRARLAGERGGTPGSEDAVELALAWLAAHQRPDGSWSLKFDGAPCQGRCANPGTTESTTGATALALLPFLGAGYTHHEGPYQAQVQKGLYYLTTRMIETSNGGDLTENVTMYAQGLATMALCEGLAMTGDENLRPFAQRAVDFICYAQHQQGGWRYSPGQPGDTTVTGWQVMALKSARLARLRVPSQTWQRAKDYLDRVQDGGGAFYGYQQPDKQPGPTSVGLLLRMYSGWPRDDERLARGATYLNHLGPSRTDIYFDYYATLVISHRGGPEWQGWNTRMREFLVETQARSGHERGSWHFPDKHGSVGGRLYTTAMAAMILEVYYRYLPLYGDDAVSF